MGQVHLWRLHWPKIPHGKYDARNTCHLPVRRQVACIFLISEGELQRAERASGLHGFTNNGTIWPSPIGLAASFNTDLLEKAAATIADEAEGLGFTQLFAPVLDMSRELRWGRVEENFGEDPFL